MVIEQLFGDSRAASECLLQIPTQSTQATIDQSRLVSGFDIEALLGERYLKMLWQTAFDAGIRSGA